MTRRIAYFITGGLALLALWYFVAYRPITSDSRAVKDAVTDVKKRLDDYNRTCLELPKFLEENRNLEEQRSELNSSLFAKSDILDLFHHLAKEAQEYDLQLVEISPPVSELLELNRRAPLDNEPQFLNVQLDFRGQFVPFGKFVEHLETEPFFRSVNTCFIHGSLDRRPTVDLTLGFRALLGSLEDQS